MKTPKRSQRKEPPILMRSYLPGARTYHLRKLGSPISLCARRTQRWRPMFESAVVRKMCHACFNAETLILDGKALPTRKAIDE